jgi:hypothetical protein
MCVGRMEGTLGQLLRMIDMCDGSEAKGVSEVSVGVGGLLIRKSIAVVSIMYPWSLKYCSRMNWTRIAEDGTCDACCWKGFDVQMSIDGSI